jgi:hypothetical protein
LRLTERQLNRATLARQLLLQRRTIGVAEAVRAVCALQAQSPPSPYIGLWDRLEDFRAEDLDRAFADEAVVKATLIRITLQAVAAEDYAAFKSAMAHDLRRSCLGDTRFTDAGLSVAQADALIPALARFARQPRTNAELETWINQNAGVPGRGVWWALRRFAPVVHFPTGGPWSFGDRPAYVASAVAAYGGDRETTLPRLVRRYLAAFGPASIADITQFTIIPQPPIKAAIAALADELVTYEGPDRKTLHDVADGAMPVEDTPAPPRLLPMFDNVLLAYRDRSRIIPEPYRKLVLRINGDTLPTVLVDGYVAGVWRPAPDRPAAVEVTAFHELTATTWDQLDAESRSLVAFVAEREPSVYGRYGHWWKTLPAADVRVLGDA